MGLGIVKGTIIVTAITLVITLLAKLRCVTKSHQMCEPTQKHNHALLWTVRFVHYWFNVFIIMYIVLFDSKYDWYVIGLLCLILIQWLFIHECILSYMEKRLIIPGYQPGQNTRYIYAEIIIGSGAAKRIYGLYLDLIFSVAILAFLIYRTNINPIWKHLIMTGYIVTIIAYIKLNMMRLKRDAQHDQTVKHITKSNRRHDNLAR